MAVAENLCLRNCIEAIDDGTFNAEQDNLIGKNVTLGELGTYDHEDRVRSYRALHCSLGNCAAWAEVDTTETPYSLHASYEVSGGDICPTLTPDELPRQTSDFGCYPAALAYALSKFGVEYTPSTIEQWMDRAAGTYPTTQQINAGLRKSLDLGFSFECVNMAGNLSILEFDDCDAWRQLLLSLERDTSGKDWIKEFWTDEEFVHQKQLFAEDRRLAQPYIENGQLSLSYMDEITYQDIEERRNNGGVLLATMRFYGREETTTHQVVVEAIKHIQSGDIIVDFYDPAYTDSSKISRRRASAIKSIFAFQYGLTFLKRHHQSK